MEEIQYFSSLNPMKNTISKLKSPERQSININIDNSYKKQSKKYFCSPRQQGRTPEIIINEYSQKKNNNILKEFNNTEIIDISYQKLKTIKQTIYQNNNLRQRQKENVKILEKVGNNSVIFQNPQNHIKKQIINQNTCKIKKNRLFEKRIYFQKLGKQTKIISNQKLKKNKKIDFNIHKEIKPIKQINPTNFLLPPTAEYSQLTLKNSKSLNFHNSINIHLDLQKNSSTFNDQLLKTCLFTSARDISNKNILMPKKQNLIHYVSNKTLHNIKKMKKILNNKQKCQLSKVQFKKPRKSFTNQDSHKHVSSTYFDQWEDIGIASLRGRLTIPNQDSVVYDQNIFVICDGNGKKGQIVARFTSQFLYQSLSYLFGGDFNAQTLKSRQLRLKNRLLKNKQDTKRIEKNINQVYREALQQLKHQDFYKNTDQMPSSAIVGLLENVILYINVGTAKAILVYQNGQELLLNQKQLFAPIKSVQSNRPKSDKNMLPIFCSASVSNSVRNTFNVFRNLVPLDQRQILSKNNYHKMQQKQNKTRNKKQVVHQYISQQKFLKPNIHFLKRSGKQSFLVIGSSGFFNCFNPQQVKSVCAKYIKIYQMNAGQIVESLVKQAKKRWKTIQHEDITCIFIDLSRYK